MSSNVIRGPWYRTTTDTPSGGRWKLEARGLLTLFSHGDLSADEFLDALDGALKRFPPAWAEPSAAEVSVSGPSDPLQWPLIHPG
jgi:hypothetical protein